MFGIDRVHIRAVQIVVAFRLGEILAVGIRCTETFQQTVEQTYLRLLGNQLCHIG